MLTALDHVNIRTANLDAMTAWYTDILGLTSGPRPAFPFPGAWLYLGNQAVVHLVGRDTQPSAGGDITLEHFAFRAHDMKAFRARLDTNGIAHTVDPVPGMALTQINLRDPDGNHIHVDFATATEDP